MLKKIDQSHMNDIKTLFLDVFSNEPWNDKWETEEHAQKYIEELMCNTNSISFGYFHEGALAGISLGYIFSWWKGIEYYIREFCVSRRLQHGGHGTRFLSLIEEHLRDDGISVIWLSTGKSVPAYRFYLKNGFEDASDYVFLAKNLR